MNIQLKIHTVFCEHKQSPQTPLMNYAKKQKLFLSLRKNSLTLDLSSHHQNSFRFLTISFRCAKVLTDMVKKKIAQAPGEGSFSTCRGKRIDHVTFSTMCSNIPAKNTILPLGYHCNIKPDNTKKCDLPGCNISTPNESWSILTGCFHSFHYKNNVLMSPLLVHCTKTFCKRKYKRLVNCKRSHFTASCN